MPESEYNTLDEPISATVVRIRNKGGINKSGVMRIYKLKEHRYLNNTIDLIPKNQFVMFLFIFSVVSRLKNDSSQAEMRVDSSAKIRRW